MRERLVCSLPPSLPLSHPAALSHLALPKVDGEVDELRVLLDQVLESVRLEKLHCLLLQDEGDGRPSEEGVPSRVLRDGKLAGVTLPDILLVPVVFRRHYHRVSNWTGEPQNLLTTNFEENSNGV